MDEDAVNVQEFAMANFDLLADDDDLNENDLLEYASPEEVEHVQKIIDDANAEESNENGQDTQDFEMADSTNRHACKSDAQIDEYAEAAHKESTKHQTKWAVNVFKGKYSTISMKYLKETSK